MARRRLTVTRLDPWSVLKFGFLANLCLLAIGLLGALVAWFFVNRLDLIDKACGVAESVGFESCGVDGGNLFRLVLLLGLLGVVIQTGLLVFLSFLHNLIADLVGGLQVSVVDEAVGSTRAASEEVRTARTPPTPAGADRTQAQPGRHPQLPGTGRAERASGPPQPPPARLREPAASETSGTDGTSEDGRVAPQEPTESIFGDRPRARSWQSSGDRETRDRS